MPGSAEVFARALEGGTQAPADGELRRELAIAGALASLGAQAGPDAAERARMRARLLNELSATPRLVRVPAPVDLAARRRSLAGLQGRLLVATAAALCLLVALSGMSLVLARDALPGDALYGVKRSAESAELGLTFGDEPRGFKHLQFATARVDEIEALTARGAGDDPRRFLTALQSFDSDAASGARLLIESATNGTGDELATLRDWAEQQALRLQVAGTAMPERAADRTTGSLTLLTKIRDRAAALQERMPCLAVTSGARDEIGLLAADGLCVPAQGGPGVLSTKLPNASQQGGGSEQGAPPLKIKPTQSEQPVEPLSPLNPGGSSSDPGSGSAGPGQGTQEPPTGATTPPPSGEASPTTDPSTITVPLPLPLPSITLPPLLPGLPGLKIG
jgi:Domain of unknown function (DUF5667)